MQKLFMENSNFRTYLIFQTFNSIGTGIFSIFMMWAIHSQYQNPIYTGLAGFMFAVSGIANFIVGPFVDKHNKVFLIRVVCLIQFCVVAFLFIISFAFTPGVWFYLGAILVYHVMTMLGVPAKTAYLPTIVSGEDLVKANALVGILGSVIGLGIGAFLYIAMAGDTGFEMIYAVNAVILFLALIATPFLKNIAQTSDKKIAKSYLSELKAGLAFVWRGSETGQVNRVLLCLVTAFVFMSIFANIASVNMPMFADIHVGGSGYILIVALGLVGGIVGSYISRIIGPKYKLGTIFVVGIIVTGIVRIIFVNVMPGNFTRSLWILVLYTGLAGAAAILFQTLRQRFPPKHLIARVSAIYISLLSAAASVGALLGGLMGSLMIDVGMIFIIQGASYIVIGIFLFFSKSIKNLPKISDMVSVDISSA